ncbi:hypothetical protein POTOM_012407 [Populus tomentosa]|uniref:Uncharacterized protein n=1 Tax=Populus tomentosa TaxID=118781 RepID=A0A8X8AL02_POPTO|nr:hypothetical protein POTOM_012407 [Populus tomentosa]
MRHLPDVASTKNECAPAKLEPYSRDERNFQILLPDSQEIRTMKDEPKSPQYTRTWVVAAVCFVIALATIFAERVLHKLGKFDFSSSMQLPTLPLDAVASQVGERTHQVSR